MVTGGGRHRRGLRQSGWESCHGQAVPERGGQIGMVNVNPQGPVLMDDLDPLPVVIAAPHRESGSMHYAGGDGVHRAGPLPQVGNRLLYGSLQCGNQVGAGGCKNGQQAHGRREPQIRLAGVPQAGATTRRPVSNSPMWLHTDRSPEPIPVRRYLSVLQMGCLVDASPALRMPLGDASYGPPRPFSSPTDLAGPGSAFR